MSGIALTVEDAPDPAAREAILAPLLAFNEAQAGPGGSRPLAVLLRDGGAVVGGLWGETSRAWLFVELVFVPEALRGRDTGTALLAAAEAEARRRGCIGAWLDTFSFQARGFYEKQGYAVVGRIEDYPPGHDRFFLAKRFAPDDKETPP